MCQAYCDMRGHGQGKTIQATPRQLESLIRMSESLAKMRLADEVKLEDVEEAVRLIKVATQQAATDPATGRIDMDLIQTGMTATSRVKIQNLTSFMKQVLGEHKDTARRGVKATVLTEELRKKAEIMGESVNDHEVQEILKLLEDEQVVTLTGSKQNPTVRLIRL